MLPDSYHKDMQKLGCLQSWQFLKYNFLGRLLAKIRLYTNFRSLSTSMALILNYMYTIANIAIFWYLAALNLAI